MELYRTSRLIIALWILDWNNIVALFDHHIPMTEAIYHHDSRNLTTRPATESDVAINVFNKAIVDLSDKDTHHLCSGSYWQVDRERILP